MGVGEPSPVEWAFSSAAQLRESFPVFSQRHQDRKEIREWQQGFMLNDVVEAVQ